MEVAKEKAVVLVMASEEAVADAQAVLALDLAVA